MTDQDTAAAALPADALDTAAGQATTNVPIATPTDRVEHVLAGLPGHTFDSVAVIAVCEAGELVGAVTIERLLAAAPAATIGEVMDPSPPAVGPCAHQEHVAWQAVDRGEG